MATTRLRVTIDFSLTPPALDVDQKGDVNHIPRSHDLQDIVWQLVGNAATGSFHPIEGTQPGFAWVGDGPPKDVFGKPELKSNGNQVGLTDLNDGPDSVGTFVYQLYATVGDKCYSTIGDLRTGAANNPVIINR